MKKVIVLILFNTTAIIKAEGSQNNKTNLNILYSNEGQFDVARTIKQIFVRVEMVNFKEVIYAFPNNINNFNMYL